MTSMREHPEPPAAADRPAGRILLHACCGPCSLEPVRVLREAGIEPVIFYTNSNIHPADEYARRLATLCTWAAGEGLDVVEGDYDAQKWEEVVGRIGDAAEAKFGVITGAEGDGDDASRAPVSEADRTGVASVSGIDRTGPASASGANRAGVNPLSGTYSVGGDFSRPAQPEIRAGANPAPQDARAAREARCRACYRMRFEEAARYAADHGFDALGTTLSVSPYQYTAIIREELERACAREGINARFEDYRPYYDEATRRSREGGMYRQNYCGCRFSDAEAAAEREERRAARRAARAAEAEAHVDERAAEEAKRARHRAEKQAYADKQARKRAILKALREQSR